MALTYMHLLHITNRTLEDLDAYYRSQPSLFVTREPDATCVRRPLKYVQHEEEEMRQSTKDEGPNVGKSEAQMVEHVE